MSTRDDLERMMAAPLRGARSPLDWETTKPVEAAGTPRKPLVLYAPEDSGDAAEADSASAEPQDDPDSAIPAFLKRLAGVPT